MRPSVRIAAYPPAKSLVRSGTRRRKASSEPTPAMRRSTILVALWVVTAACSYFAASSPPGFVGAGLAWLLVAAMAVGNGIVSRVRPESIITVRSGVVIAALYTSGLFAAWHVGGQGSVELMVGAIALLDLALVGLSLAELGAIALALVGTYVLIN